MATETTLTTAKGWSPDVSAFAPATVISEALVIATSTVVGRIEGDEPVVRVIWVDDDEAQIVAEGGVIPEGDPGLNEVLVATSKVAQLVRVSREQYEQLATATELAESVRRAVVKKSDLEYLTNPTTGLLNVADTVDGGAVGTDLDALADAVATIEAAGGTATHVLAAPDAWSGLRKIKSAADSKVSLLGAGTNDAERRVLGLPVLTSPAMPAGALLVLDRTGVVSAVGDVQVATSADAYFTSDSIALRATFRFGANTVRADRIVKLTLTA